MTKTRNIADLLDANGDVVSGALDNVPASNDASALTTGTLPSARLGTVTSFTSTGIDDNADATAITINSSEQVGIGETSMQGTLHVKTSDSGVSSSPSHSNDLVVENSTNGGITLNNGASNSGTITFQNSTNADDGAISYRNSDRQLRFKTAGADRLTIGASGDLGIGENSLATLTGNSSPGLIIKSDAPFIVLKDGNNSNKVSYIANNGGILSIGRVDDDLSSNKVQAMQVDNEGNVSIGTTSSLHNLHVQANGETTDSWLRHGHTLSCSGSWGGGKQIQVDWDITSSVSYAFEFITASYGSRKHFVVGSYYAGSSHQTTMTDNGSGSMTQGGNSGGERWTSSGGTHGVYCCRITTAGGHHNALVTLL